MIQIDLSTFYTETAKIQQLPDYLGRATAEAGDGEEVILTGKAPVWLYLCVAHALHGKVKKLIYRSPVSGDVVIFDHNPY